MSLKILVWLSYLLYLQPLYSVAQDNIKAPLTVVANPNPLLQYHEEGEDKGPTVEILNSILKLAKLNANIYFMPWARAFSEAKNNTNTLILSMIRTPEREADFHWIIKVSQATRVFISLKSKPENYVDTIEQAKEKLVGVILNSSAHQELKAAGFSEDKNIYLISSVKQLAWLLANGKIDLAYTDPDNIEKNLQAINKADVEINHKGVSFKNQRISYIALNVNTDEKTVEKLRLAAKKFTETSKYTYLLTK